MRALTVLQPWAHAIAHCGKRVENRGSSQWLGGYRGPLLIHAGLSRQFLMDDRVCFELSLITGGRFPTTASAALPLLMPSFGHIVAIATVADVVQQHDAYKLAASARAWYDGSKGGIGLVLKDVRALATPVKASGMQGLWTPSRELVAAVMDSLEGKTAEQQSRGGSKAANSETEKSGPVRGGGLFGTQGRML